jgi:hypothetical protein
MFDMSKINQKTFDTKNNIFKEMSDTLRQHYPQNIINQNEEALWKSFCSKATAPTHPSKFMGEN